MKRGQRGIVALLALVAALVLSLAGVAGAQQSDPQVDPSTTTSTTSTSTTTTSTTAPSTTVPATVDGTSTYDPSAGSGDPGVVQPSTDPVPGHYLVTLRTKDKKKVVPDVVGVTKRHGGKVTQVWGDALQGYAAEMTPEQAAAVARDPQVERVEQDSFVHTQTTENLGYSDPIKTSACTLTTDPAHPGFYAVTLPMQNGPDSWGLDRIDQSAPLVYTPTSTNLPIGCASGSWVTTPKQNSGGSYTYQADGAGVTAYVIDTGIYISNTDFEGRASVGVDEVGDGQNGIDCAGHGTHVAGTIGGKKYGVAKKVNLVAVRVLDCSGNGTYADVVDGVNWVVANAQRPAVANMSLGGPASSTLDAAVAAAVDSGITFGVAAGNNSSSTNVKNSCNYSPARTPSAITVGATTFSQTNTGDPFTAIVDDRASYSNGGSCVDIFGPGSKITSDWFGSTTATNTISGTSMATPHVMGAAALLLSANPCATPAEVTSALIGNSVSNAIKGYDAALRPSLTVYDTNSPAAPNKLLNTQFIGSNAVQAPCPVTATATAGSGTVHLSWNIPFSPGSALEGFQIHRATAPGAEGGAPIATPSAATTTFDDNTVTNGTTYYYTVTATNSSGSSVSNEVSALPGNPPGAPALDSPTTASNTVNLSWTAPGSDGGSPITGYKVYRGTSPGGESPTPVTTVGAGVTSYSDTTATNGTTWYYEVAAVNAIGETASNERNATPTGPPTAPTGLTATPGTNSVTLTWSAPANAGGLTLGNYKVFRSTTSGFTPSGGNQVATPAGTTYVDNSVTNGTTYYYVVEATNVAGDSAPSAQVAGTPVPPISAIVRGGGDGMYANRAVGNTFSGFAPIPGVTSTSNPSVVFDGTRTIAFVRGPDGALWSATLSGPGPSWSSWTSRGGYIVLDPVAVTDGAGNVRIFVVGGDSALYVGSMANGGAVTFTRLGGVITAPAGAAFDGTNYQVLVRGGDNGLYSARLLAGGGFSGFTPRGGYLSAAPAVAMDGSTVKTYVRGGDLGLYTATANPDGSGFSGFTPRGGTLFSTPRVANDGGGVRLVLRGSDSQLWTAKWSGGSFGAFTPLGGQIITDPALVSDGVTTRVFVVGIGNGLWTGTLKPNGSAWTGFTPLGGFITAVPAAAAGL